MYYNMRRVLRERVSRIRPPAARVLFRPANDGAVGCDRGGRYTRAPGPRTRTSGTARWRRRRGVRDYSARHYRPVRHLICRRRVQTFIYYFDFFFI